MKKRAKSVRAAGGDQDILKRLREGDLRVLSRLISRAENRDRGIVPILSELYREKSIPPVIGITGPPGAGKSTLCNAFVKEIRKKNESVSIVAVDPVSPFTGGAILADRIRLSDHFNDPKVFIRSLSTRGKLGGLSLAARQVVQLCSGFGFDKILLETVGVGQSEVDVRNIADLTLVVLVPEWGDAIQALKAGLLEIGDIFAVHKADREGADRVASEIRKMLELQGQVDCPVLLSSAQKVETLEVLFSEVMNFLRSRASLIKQRRERAAQLTLREFLEDYVAEESKTWVESLVEPRKNPYQYIQKFLKDHRRGELFK